MDMKRKALGKGLSALLPDPEPQAPARASLDIPIDQIDPNPFQPRSQMDPARLKELIASIAESGIIQPIIVRAAGPRYQIIAGERRFRAAQQLGFQQVPVVVRDVPDDRLLEIALIENIQREELSPLEEAQAYSRLQDEFRLTQDEIARKVGRDRSTISNTLRLLRLPREVRALLAEGKLDAGHTRALLALEKSDQQVALAKEAVRRGLSVREIERRVTLARTQPMKRTDRRDPNTRAAEERLRGALGTSIEIVRKGKGGQIRIVFTNETELNRIYESILRLVRSRS
jgi:ParB family chromosome partitioning protein